MRKKKLKSVNLIVLLIITIILVINMGYSLYNESLTIGGSATTITPVAGDALNIEIVNNSVGSICTNPKDPMITPMIYGGYTDTLNGNTLLTIDNEEVSMNNLIITTSWRMSFKNISGSNFTNGIANLQVVSGSNSIISSSSQTPASLSINATGEMTGQVRFNQTRKVQILITIQYLVNGVLKYFYYDLTININ